MTTIAFEVGDEIAHEYNLRTEEEQRKLPLLLALRLCELTTGPLRLLSVIMDEIGSRAERLGLTSEKLR